MRPLAVLLLLAALAVAAAPPVWPPRSPEPEITDIDHEGAITR